MPKTKISEYSSTAADNTDIDGINLAEGMLPSDVNNAIRELMAQLKDFQTGSAGDGATFSSLNLTTTALSVPSGGTGVKTLTGIVKANGTSAFSAATAGTDYAKSDTASTWSASQRGTVTTDNDGSFDMNATNNFSCTPTGNFTLTFTNITAGQSGFILLVNTGGHTISAAATTKVQTGALAAISAVGTYILNYWSNGTNVYVTHSGAMA